MHDDAASRDTDGLEAESDADETMTGAPSDGGPDDKVGVTEWVSEFRRLYVETKPDGQVIEEEPVEARHRRASKVRFGRRRHGHQAPEPPAPPVRPVAPPPGLAALAATEPSVSEAPTGDSSTRDAWATPPSWAPEPRDDADRPFGRRKFDGDGDGDGEGSGDDLSASDAAPAAEPQDDEPPAADASATVPDLVSDRVGSWATDSWSSAGAETDAATDRDDAIEDHTATTSSWSVGTSWSSPSVGDDAPLGDTARDDAAADEVSDSVETPGHADEISETAGVDDAWTPSTWGSDSPSADPPTADGAADKATVEEPSAESPNAWIASLGTWSSTGSSDTAEAIAEEDEDHRELTWSPVTGTWELATDDQDSSDGSGSGASVSATSRVADEPWSPTDPGTTSDDSVDVGEELVWSSATGTWERPAAVESSDEIDASSTVDDATEDDAALPDAVEVVDAATSTVDEATPTVDEATPTVDEASPTVDEASPAVDVEASAVDGPAPIDVGAAEANTAAASEAEPPVSAERSWWRSFLSSGDDAAPEPAESSSVPEPEAPTAPVDRADEPGVDWAAWQAELRSSVSTSDDASWPDEIDEDDEWSVAESDEVSEDADPTPVEAFSETPLADSEVVEAGTGDDAVPHGEVTDRQSVDVERAEDGSAGASVEEPPVVEAEFADGMVADATRIAVEPSDEPMAEAVSVDADAPAEDRTVVAEAELSEADETTGDVGVEESAGDATVADVVDEPAAEQSSVEAVQDLEADVTAADAADEAVREALLDEVESADEVVGVEPVENVDEVAETEPVETLEEVESAGEVVEVETVEAVGEVAAAEPVETAGEVESADEVVGVETVGEVESADGVGEPEAPATVLEETTPEDVDVADDVVADQPTDDPGREAVADEAEPVVGTAADGVGTEPLTSATEADVEYESEAQVEDGVAASQAAADYDALPWVRSDDDEDASVPMSAPVATTANADTNPVPDVAEAASEVTPESGEAIADAAPAAVVAEPVIDPVIDAAIAAAASSGSGATQAAADYDSQPWVLSDEAADKSAYGWFVPPPDLMATIEAEAAAEQAAEDAVADAAEGGAEPTTPEAPAAERATDEEAVATPQLTVTPLAELLGAPPPEVLLGAGAVPATSPRPAARTTEVDPADRYVAPPVHLSWRVSDGMEFEVPSVVDPDQDILIEPPTQMVQVTSRRADAQERRARSQARAEEREREAAEAQAAQDAEAEAAAQHARVSAQKGSRRRAVVLFVILVVLAAGGWFFFQQRGSGEAGPDPTPSVSSSVSSSGSPSASPSP